MLIQLYIVYTYNCYFLYLKLEIKNHTFFSPINWDDLYHKRITPPYNPNVVSCIRLPACELCCSRLSSFLSLFMSSVSAVCARLHTRDLSQISLLQNKAPSKSHTLHIYIFFQPLILTYMYCFIFQRGPADTQHIDPEFTKEMVPNSVSRTPEFNASTSANNAFNGFSFVGNEDSFLWGRNELFKCLNKVIEWSHLFWVKSSWEKKELLVHHCRNPTWHLSTTAGISI